MHARQTWLKVVTIQTKALENNWFILQFKNLTTAKGKPTRPNFLWQYARTGDILKGPSKFEKEKEKMNLNFSMISHMHYDKDP